MCRGGGGEDWRRPQGSVDARVEVALRVMELLHATRLWPGCVRQAVMSASVTKYSRSVIRASWTLARARLRLAHSLISTYKRISPSSSPSSP